MTFAPAATGQTPAFSHLFVPCLPPIAAVPESPLLYSCIAPGDSMLCAFLATYNFYCDYLTLD